MVVSTKLIGNGRSKQKVIFEAVTESLRYYEQINSRIVDSEGWFNFVNANTGHIPIKLFIGMEAVW